MLVPVALTADLVLEVEDGLVVAQLQDVEHAPTGLSLDQGKLIEQLGRRYQRLFADHVTSQAQAG
ncbi:hypothetical protein D3C72_1901720 [compost metagenome]